MLLRIVAAAGASTVVGMASCGGDVQTHGLLPLSEPSDAQVDDGSPVGAIDSGLVAFPGDEDGSPVGVIDSGLVAFPGDEDFTGFVVNPDAEVHGIVVHPEDAGTDGPLPDDADTDAQTMGVVTGVVVNPHDAGHDSGATHSCPPLCGVVVGIGPNPGH